VPPRTLLDLRGDPLDEAAPGQRLVRFLEAFHQEDGLRGGFRHHEVIPAQPALRAEAWPSAYAALAPALARRGIASLFAHQVRALASLDAGRDVVLATPTASGKTLVYELPVLRAARAGETARALFLFPLKALARDQRDRLIADAEMSKA
jgi:DEAD/DEAH box helicase domain-containing protein